MARRKKEIPPYKVVNWDFNRDEIEFYDIMPYLVSSWDEDKKRKRKIWAIMANHGKPEKEHFDDTKMPETFEEFKTFVKENSFSMYWGRCEYEVIVTGWPVQKNEHKMDVFDQIQANLDVVTKHFMNYIKGD